MVIFDEYQLIRGELVVKVFTRVNMSGLLLSSTGSIRWQGQRSCSEHFQSHPRWHLEQPGRIST